MADNIGVTQGSGTNVATDEIAGVHYQRVKQCFGVDGSATDVSPSNPLPTESTVRVDTVETSVSVTDANATLLAANANRKYAFVQNHGPSNVYVTTDNANAIANGTATLFPVLAAREWKGTLAKGKFSAICATGGNATVHVEEG